MRLQLDAVKTLLSEAKLPAVDVTESHLEHFFARGPADAPTGIVGLELYPPNALLRSLVVASSARGQGLGTALLADAERHARKHEVQEIYLLTTTAERFFARAGYERVPREAAPPSIQETVEFSTLCSASAALMHKRL